MILVCPHVPGGLREETRAAIIDYAAPLMDIRFAPLDPDDVYAYGRLLHDLWAEGRSFAIVEQDIVIRPDVVAGFLRCPCNYGGFPYEVGTGVAVCLGCTRFRAGFIYDHFAALDQTIAFRRAWNQLDVTLQRRVLFDRYGQQPHICGAPVEHLNETKQLRPGADPEPVAMLPQGRRRP